MRGILGRVSRKQPTGLRTACSFLANPAPLQGEGARVLQPAVRDTPPLREIVAFARCRRLATCCVRRTSWNVRVHGTTRLYTYMWQTWH